MTVSIGVLLAVVLAILVTYWAGWYDKDAVLEAPPHRWAAPSRFLH